jgi:hypothetical protein
VKSLVKFIELDGKELGNGKGDVVVLCPFHTEKTPSCVVSLTRNVFVCLSCGASGKAIYERTRGRRMVELAQNGIVEQGDFAADLMTQNLGLPKIKRTKVNR